MLTNIAVFVSGGGTNLQALIDAEKAGIIKSGKIKLVVSSSPTAYALERAANSGIDSVVVSRKENPDQNEFEQKIINALEEKGYRVPDDVSVTGFDDSDFASNFKVPLTTMRHPQRGLGETAAELLVKLMKGEKPEDDRMHMVMESELIVRESTKRR